MRVLIDDERFELPDGTIPDLIARTWQAGVLVLSFLQETDELYLDHDLGDSDPHHSGYALIAEFERFIAYRLSKGATVKVPHKIVCVSANVPGAGRIEAAVASIRRLQDLPKTRSTPT